jgi:1-acyl-sn-glycerol-3-phosphate acyltransferase
MRSAGGLDPMSLPPLPMDGGGLLYKSGRRGFYTLCRLLDVRLELHGLANIPDSGPGVLAANHISVLDWAFAPWPLSVQGSRPVRFVVKERWLRHPVTGPLIRRMGTHIPVSGRPGAYQMAREALQRGELVVIFPEGRISRSLELGRFRIGAARLGFDTGAPIVPVALWGTQTLWPPGRRPVIRSLRHVPVSVTYGPPIVAGEGERPAELNHRLREAVGTLLNEARSPQAEGGSKA